MARFQIRIQGTTALMQHKLPQATLMGFLGSKTKQIKDKVVKEPREIAQEHAYQDTEGSCFVPPDYIVGAFREAASEYKQSSKSRKSMKGIAASIFRVEDPMVFLIHDGKRIKDFEVDIRAATNHKVGKVAVCRPRFDRWAAVFTAYINDEVVDPDVAHQILVAAGTRVGLGSFRVSKGGYFGQFNVTEWKELK